MKYLLPIALALLSLVLCIWLPSSWIISDVYSYFNMAMAINQGDVSLFVFDPVDGELISQLGTQYPLGTSCWLAFWLLILGKKYIFLSSAIAVLGGVWLTNRSIVKVGYSSLGSWWMLALLPLHFYSKTLMSGVPSFLISGLFLYLLISMEERGLKWLVLCFLAVMSGWFREVNIALLGGICFAHFVIHHSCFLCYVSGSLLGMIPRLVSSFVIYDDPLKYVLSEPMKLITFIDQAPLYMFLIIILFPGLIFFIVNYRGKYYREILFGTLFLILIYWSYGYDATQYSGFLRGTLVNSRFLLPTVPFVALSVAWFFTRIKIPKWAAGTVAFLTVVVIVSAHGMVYKEHKKHHDISQYVEHKYRNELVYYDMTGLTNVLRYINPLATNMDFTSNIVKLENPEYVRQLSEYDGDVYAIVSVNTASQVKTHRSNQMIQHLDKHESLSVNIHEDIAIEPDLILRVYKLK